MITDNAKMLIKWSSKHQNRKCEHDNKSRNTPKSIDVTTILDTSHHQTQIGIDNIKTDHTYNIKHNNFKHATKVHDFKLATKNEDNNNESYNHRV